METATLRAGQLVHVTRMAEDGTWTTPGVVVGAGTDRWTGRDKVWLSFGALIPGAVVNATDVTPVHTYTTERVPAYRLQPGDVLAIPNSDPDAGDITLEVRRVEDVGGFESHRHLVKFVGGRGELTFRGGGTRQGCEYVTRVRSW